MAQRDDLRAKALQNLQQFEVLISINDMAASAARTAVALAKGEKFKFDTEVNNGMAQVKTINTPVFAVDKAQIDARIVKTGFQTREALYGKTASSN